MKKILFQNSDEFAEWLFKLERQTANRITATIRTVEITGVFPPSAKMLEKADKICSLKFEFGSGYRVYYCQIGSNIYLLLIGGDKARQQHDIEMARKIKKRELEDKR